MPDADLLQLIELLTACPCLSTLAGRELVIKDLRFAVPRSHRLTDKQDVAEIARAVLNYPDGCARLWEIINFYDGATLSTKNLTEYLQRTGQLSGVADRSQPEYAAAKHNLPFSGRDPRFTGRETQLAELRRMLLLEGGAAALVVTKGQGGVGKTSLAREYAYRHLSAYKIIGWLDAETETSRMTSFWRLARLLGLLGLEGKDKKTEEEVRRAVLEKLETTTGWLLIYDNADDPAQLKEWLPKAYTGHILITSRAQNWQYAKPLTVPLMPEAECLALLLQWLERQGWPDEKERRVAAELSNDLGYLTLAVAQAGAYIKAVGVSIADYLTLFKEERLALFEEEDAQLADRKDRDNVATTYRLNIRKLEETNPAARDLLNLVAFFAPIPFRLEALKYVTDKLPKSIRELVLSPLLLNRATADLRRYSLADVTDGRITLHRMIGLVIRSVHLSEDERKIWTTTAGYILITLLQHLKGSKDSTLSGEIFAHAIISQQQNELPDVAFDVQLQAMLLIGKPVNDLLGYLVQSKIPQSVFTEDANDTSYSDYLAEHADLVKMMKELDIDENITPYLTMVKSNKETIAWQLRGLSRYIRRKGNSKYVKNRSYIYEQLDAIRIRHEAVYGVPHPDLASDFDRVLTSVNSFDKATVSRILLERSTEIYNNELSNEKGIE